MKKFKVGTVLFNFFNYLFKCNILYNKICVCMVIVVFCWNIRHIHTNQVDYRDGLQVLNKNSMFC